MGIKLQDYSTTTIMVQGLDTEKSITGEMDLVLLREMYNMLDQGLSAREWLKIANFLKQFS